MTETEPEAKTTLADLDLDVLSDALIGRMVVNAARAGFTCSNSHCSNKPAEEAVADE